MESEAGREIGVWGMTSRVVSPVSITSVAIRIAPRTRTTRPPSTPDKTFGMREVPSTSRGYRRGASITSKRHGRQRCQGAEPCTQPSTVAERAPQVPSRGGVRRLPAERSEAPLAQHPHVARGSRACPVFEPRLELPQREPRGRLLAGPRQRTPQSGDVDVVTNGLATAHERAKPQEDEDAGAEQDDRGYGHPGGDRRVRRRALGAAAVA